MTETILTPVGRAVQGDLYVANTKDMQGQPLTIKSGPNRGQPRSEYFIALAFAKTDPAWPAFERHLKAVAAQSFPALFPSGATGPWPHASAFSSKIWDGDGVDGKGKSNALKPGFAGHWVVKFSTGFAPSVWATGQLLGTLGMAAPGDSSAYVQCPKDHAKLGYYYRLAAMITGNGQHGAGGSPGLYCNYNMAELVGIGEEIVLAGADPNQVFGSSPTAAPHVAAAAHSSAMARPAAAGPAAPTASPISTASPPPYSGYMTATAPPPPGPVMTPKAGGHSYESMRAAGWSDDALRAHGYMM